MSVQTAAAPAPIGSKIAARRTAKVIGRPVQAAVLAGSCGAYQKRLLYAGVIGGIGGLVLGRRLSRVKVGVNGATCETYQVMYAFIEGDTLGLIRGSAMLGRPKELLVTVPLRGARVDVQQNTATAWVKVSSTDGQVVPFELMTVMANKKRSLPFLEYLQAKAAGQV